MTRSDVKSGNPKNANEETGKVGPGRAMDCKNEVGPNFRKSDASNMAPRCVKLLSNTNGPIWAKSKTEGVISRRLQPKTKDSGPERAED